MLHDKRDFLFKFVPPPLRYAIRMDDESLYSVTDQHTADTITKDVMRFLPSTSAVVVDGTACVGGNTISFAKVYSNVHAIEIDKVRFDYLEENLKTLNISNVTCHHADMVRACKTINCECSLIFIDPPWGGPTYKSRALMDLYLQTDPLHAICRELAMHTRYFGLKVPLNFNEEAFVQNTRDFLKLVHKNSKLRKIQFLLFEVGR